MKRILMSIVAILLPWVILLAYDNLAGALLALIMQASIIGWPFAIVWAWKLIHAKKTK